MTARITMLLLHLQLLTLSKEELCSVGIGKANLLADLLVGLASGSLGGHDPLNYLHLHACLQTGRHVLRGFRFCPLSVNSREIMAMY